MTLLGPRTRKLLRRSFGYGGVFSLAFSLTLYWSFPYELIGERFIGDVERQLGMDLEVTSLSPYWLSGLEAEGVILKTRPRRANAEPVEIPLDRLSARLRPLDSLLSGLTVGIEAEAPLGSLSGKLQRQAEDRVALELDIERLSVGELPGVWDSLGVGFQGEASGTVSLTLPPAQPVEMDGVLDLTVSGARFGGGMIRGFTVPGVDLGTLPLKVSAEKGRVSFEPPLTVDSSDLAAEVAGTIELRPVLATSKSDLKIRFKPTDAFWKSNEKLAGLAQAMLKAAQGADGYYAYEMSGRLGRPDFKAGRGR